MRSAAILFVAAVAANGQSSAPAPAFDVASVKLFAPLRTGGGMRYVFRDVPASVEISGTRVTLRGNLMGLVAFAYGMERFQVSQGPDWMEKWATSEGYDIAARAPGDAVPPLAQVRQMTQALLADRFQLKVSRRTEVMPVYNLVVAPGGPKFGPSEFTDPPLTRDEGSSGAQIRTRFLNFSIAEFAERVRHQFDRPLLDKTGLAGGFDFSLSYTAQIPGMTPAQAAAIGLPDPEPGLPIAASIREQLGLRVVAAKEPVEILVIDHAERPSEN